MRESNPRRWIKSPLHYHYANQAWKWWDLNPQLLYAKQIFYQLNYIPFLKPIGFEPISIVSKTTALPIKLGFSLPRQLPLARPCYDLAPIVNQGFFTN